MDTKDVVLRQHDAVWCRGDLSAVDELFAADFVGRPSRRSRLDRTPSRQGHRDGGAHVGQ